MAKGKNHDRKSQPGFNKPKSTSTSDFTMKKVKGASRRPHNYPIKHTDPLSQARTSIAMRKRRPR